MLIKLIYMNNYFYNIYTFIIYQKVRKNYHLTFSVYTNYFLKLNLDKIFNQIYDLSKSFKTIKFTNIF